MFRSRELPDLLKPEAFLYYSRDNLMTVPYWAKHGAQMEPEIMRAASAVVTNSPHLANLAAKANDNSIYVGQGCEIDEYLNVDKDQVPNDLKSLQGPIVGYTGLLTSRRLSIDLIEYAAKKLPHFNFVLVGPEESCFEKSILHELENVFFLGSKKPEDLPAYVSNFDVCINPQIVNELTKGNYPRKVDEYLAAGKPVVATYTPTMEVFKKYCFLVNNGDEFVRALEVAKNSVDEVNIRERQDFAATHSWGNSVKEIYRVVEDVLNNKIKAYA